MEEKSKREKLFEQKLRNARNPDCILIAPRTKEGHALVKMLMVFNKAVSVLKTKAIVAGKQEFSDCLKKVFEFTENALDFWNLRLEVRSPLAPIVSEIDPHTQTMLVKKPNSYAFIPATGETKLLAKIINNIDYAISNLKTNALGPSDQERLSVLVKETVKWIREFDSLIDEVISLVGFVYFPQRWVVRLRSGGRELAGEGRAA